MNDLTPQETYRRMKDEGLVLVDVREDYEWESGHPAGALHVPLSRLTSSEDAVPGGRPVAFICLAGMRSAQAAAAYEAKGFETYNVVGGFHAWFDDELPSEPENARLMPH